MPQIMADNLTADGYDVTLAHDCEQALRLLAVYQPQLVIADVNGDTLGLLDAVRAGDRLAGRIDPDTPLIVLTAHADELARIRVFERGGDDVISKPLSYPELRGRVGALLRRTQQRPHEAVARVGALTVNPSSREVRVGEQPVTLTGKEYELLRVLMSDPTRVFSKAALLRDVWGFRAQGRTRTLDTHACRLRRKLNTAGASGPFVVNVWGVGYALCPPAPCSVPADRA